MTPLRAWRALPVDRQDNAVNLLLQYAELSEETGPTVTGQVMRTAARLLRASAKRPKAKKGRGR